MPDYKEDTAFLIYNTFYNCHCPSCVQRKRLGMMPFYAGAQCALPKDRHTEAGLTLQAVLHIERQLQLPQEERITPDGKEIKQRYNTHGANHT